MVVKCCITLNLAEENIKPVSFNNKPLKPYHDKKHSLRLEKSGLLPFLADDVEGD